MNVFPGPSILFGQCELESEFRHRVKEFGGLCIRLIGASIGEIARIRWGNHLLHYDHITFANQLSEPLIIAHFGVSQEPDIE